MFKKEPTGKYLVQICRTLSCKLRGAEEVTEHICNKLGIKLGETTPDNKFTVIEVECLGSCGTAPMMQINNDYYENLTKTKINNILDSLE
jgi:NADH-quinone oxidoreductase subunit E